ncbi:NYN domain-containing protein [Pseudomonas putida]|uniref:NYN domain-containing protein n=1 Tax=Pseudomonas putida TaxID=303 RepID=A0A2Z4RD53_PSEPU|nr:NYN domain-containing protein [Pseudomonas putida]AWY39040.1 NYN domain-containing protein [Pseudomonas putida]
MATHTSNNAQKRLAVLIDADNAPAAIVEGLFEEIAKYGVASVKRIYGDWTGPHLGGWKKVLFDYSIQPIQQFAYPNAAWASWGDYDARQLERDAAFARRPSLLEGLPHFNARKWHAGLYDNRPKGLMQTVESLGLKWQGTYHRGIDDAKNVASIIKEMLG